VGVNEIKVNHIKRILASWEIFEQDKVFCKSKNMNVHSLIVSVVILRFLKNLIPKGKIQRNSLEINYDSTWEKSIWISGPHFLWIVRARQCIYGWICNLCAS